MPVVFAAVLPHGWLLIPALDPSAGGALATRAALGVVERRVAELGVDVVVVVTPHGIRVDGMVALASTARAAGTLRHAGRVVETNVDLDGPLTEAIAAAAHARSVPVAMVGFAGNSWAESAVPLDWGTMVPLWFLGHGRSAPGRGDVLADPPEMPQSPAVVIAAPSRVLPRERLVTFGEALTEAAARDVRRIAVVASCDWAHTHVGGRYGESPAARAVDAAVVAALEAGDPRRLLTLTAEDIERAAVDGLWQALVLAGVLARTPMVGGVLSYEVPPAYATGMVVAAYEPAG